MLWIKAFHIIFLVTWFSGLFYLPRLFVYHANTLDTAGQQRFKIMDWKLFYIITTPGGILTILFGLWLFHYNPEYYAESAWMQVKLALVALLIIYHIYLGKLLYSFRNNRNYHSQKFYRWINEVPTVFLIIIVILAVVKPF